MSEPTDWHLVCVTRHGKVSILKNLDLRTARETYKTLMPDERPETYKYPDCDECRRFGAIRYGGFTSSSDRDCLKRVEAIGPEGEDLDPWFGVEPRLVDLSHCEHKRAMTMVDPSECTGSLHAVLLAASAHDNHGMPIPMTAFEKHALEEANR